MERKEGKRGGLSLLSRISIFMLNISEKGGMVNGNDGSRDGRSHLAAVFSGGGGCGFLPFREGTQGIRTKV